MNHQYVALAAGRGIEPLLPTLQALLSRDPASRVQLFYGNRNREQAVHAEELLALKDRYLDRFALHFLMSGEPQEIEWLNGRLDAAKLASLAGRLFEPKQVRTFLLSGPGSMNEDLSRALGALGVDASHIHVESLAAEGATAETSRAAASAGKTPGTAGSGGNAATSDAATTPGAAMTEVTVIMDGRRRSFSMRTHEGTVLDAAAEAGIDLPFSCKAGVCSTCRTKLVSGKVELAQNYALEDWELEQGFILACQAHATTPQLEITYDET